MTRCYAWPLTVRAGDDLMLHVSTGHRRFGVRLFRFGASVDEVPDQDLVYDGYQLPLGRPDEAWGWPRYSVSLAGALADDPSEPLVLGRLERIALEALELDADREVVAVPAPPPCRRAGVPCALAARDELQQRAIAADQEVGRDAKAAKGREGGMRRGVERVAEEPLDGVAAVLARRQADRMDDDQIDWNARRAWPEVRRLPALGVGQPAVAPTGRSAALRARRVHSRSPAPESPPTLTLRRAMR